VVTVQLLSTLFFFFANELKMVVSVRQQRKNVPVKIRQQKNVKCGGGTPTAHEKSVRHDLQTDPSV
jgi:hypothetical protein